MAVIFSFFLGTSCRRPAPGVQIPAGTFRDCPTFWDRPHCVNRVCGRKPTRQVFFTFVIPLWSFNPAKTFGAVLALPLVMYNIFSRWSSRRGFKFFCKKLKIRFSTWSKALASGYRLKARGSALRHPVLLLSTPIFHDLIINKPRYASIVSKEGAQYSGIRYILERSCGSSCKNSFWFMSSFLIADLIIF